MNRYLTDEELFHTKEGDLLCTTVRAINEAIELGALKDCKIAKPLITDDSNIINFVNQKTKCDSEYMYYIPVIGTKKRFKLEANCLRGLIEVLSEREGEKFSNNATLIHVNSVSIGDEKDKQCPYRHNIILLFKDDKSTNLVS